MRYCRTLYLRSNGFVIRKSELKYFNAAISNISFMIGMITKPEYNTSMKIPFDGTTTNYIQKNFSMPLLYKGETGDKIRTIERNFIMNDKKKVSIAVVILNCICAAVWNISLFVDLVYGYTNSVILVLYIVCAIVWDICAIVWIIRYQNSKKNNK